MLEYNDSPFAPGPEIWEWVAENILEEGGPLHNPDHAHLQQAHIGFIWAGTENARRGRQVIGQAEDPVFRCGAWQKGRQEQQIKQWFEDIPDFLITLDAQYCAQCTDIEFAALIEHELYHCAQKLDPYGSPKFSKDTGKPMYTLKGHDVEEFVGVVRRYGVGNPEGALAQLVEAAKNKPEVANINISSACGTCQLRLAS